MPSEDSDLNIRRQSFWMSQNKEALSCLSSIYGPPCSTALLLVLFTLGAATFALLQWLTTTAFRSNTAATVTVGDPRPAELIANSPSAGWIEAALVKGAGVERWCSRKHLLGPAFGTLAAWFVLIFLATASSHATRLVEEFQPGVKWGGRSVAITTASNRVIVATESGGLFRSADGGASWTHLDGLPPFRVFDVKYAPSDDTIVLATAMRDSRTANGGGIWRSMDGGDTWQRPASVDPPAGGSCPARANAYGIAFQPGSSNVFVGTDCGLAISGTLGASWTHVSPEQAIPRVWSVAASGNGTIYICGDGGIRLSQNQGATWSPPFQGLGTCAFAGVQAIDFSPGGQSVFVVSASGRLFRCDPTGAACVDMQGPPFSSNARQPMVRASPATGNSINVYFGNQGGLFQQSCLIVAPSLRCGTNWGAQLATGHSDLNDIAFGVGSCPSFVVTDGGVQKTTDCGNTWVNVATGPAGFHALGVYDVAGQIHPDHTDVYFGTQDNGLWSSGDDGGLTWPPPPTAPFDQEGGGFQLERRCPDHKCRLIAWQATGGIFSTTAHFAATLPWTGPPGNPQGCTPTVVSRGVYMQFAQAANSFANTLFLTADSGGTWKPIATINQTLTGCPQVSGPPDNPTLYQPIFLSGTTRMGDPIISLVRITGILPLGTTVSVSQIGQDLHSLGVYCMGQGVWPVVGCPIVFGVSRTDPLRLIAPDTDTGEMKKSADGGGHWKVDTGLTALVTGQGTFQFNFALGDAGIRMQVHVVAFDPDNGSHILVGTEAAGLVESFDGGDTWNLVGSSNRVTAVSSVFFKDDNTVVVGSYGRGLWKVRDCGQPCEDAYSTCQDNCIADFEACPAETPRVNCVQALKACMRACTAARDQCLASCK